MSRDEQLAIRADGDVAWITTDIEDIHFYYQGYVGLVTHWQSVYPGQILTLHYERLVHEPERAIRDLLEFCGLDFEPACLEFHKQKRAVMTPSVSQVSRPMYTSSIGHWRNFEPYVPEAMARLGELAGTGR